MIVYTEDVVISIIFILKCLYYVDAKCDNYYLFLLNCSLLQVYFWNQVPKNSLKELYLLEEEYQNNSL